jgi:nitric oxide reductase NorD protein
LELIVATREADNSTLSAFYELFPWPALARDLFNVAESYRIDARIRAAYPGIKRDMDAVYAASGDDRPELSVLSDPQAVVEALLQIVIGHDPDLTDVPTHTRELIDASRAELERLTDESTTVADTARCVAEIFALIADNEAQARTEVPSPDLPEQPDVPDQPQQPEQPQPDMGDEGEGDYEPLELPQFMTPVMEELVRPPQDSPAQREANTEERDPERPGEEQLVDDADQAMGSTQPELGEASPDEVAQQSDSSSEGDDEGDAASDRKSDEESTGSGTTPEQAVDAVAQGDSQPEEDLGEQTFMYDEWDYRIEDYRPAWCTLRETRSTRMQESFVAATFHEFGGIVSQIRRNFQLMRPERLRKMRFQTEGDDLDTDGLVEYVVEKRAKISPSGRVYIKRDKKDRDVATAFLVDMSSSTDRKIDGRKRIIDIEKEGLLLMCEALEAIRDDYAIYGFSGSGREDCQFYVVKELGEKYDDRVKGRIGGIYARQKTRMGPAIRHATRRLVAADAAVKLMILLTDGKPYDSDTYQDNKYAQEDTQVALREARREKIHLFCVTVDQEAADYLPHMYSDANFVIIDDVRTLPHKLPQLYRRLTT